MSILLDNAPQSQIITNNHFLHHPKVDSELIYKHEHARLDMENIYFLPLASGNNHNYDGKSVIEIRKLGISKEYWPFSYTAEACGESDGVTTAGRTLYRNLKITSALDEVCGGIRKKAHAATELAESLRLSLLMKNPSDPAEDYTVHEIALGPGCNIPGYARTTIGYISTLPVSQTKR